MKTFCIYHHKPRGLWQIMYRTRVTPCEAFPRGVALLHLGFSSTYNDAVVRRNEWFSQTFGSGGLAIAWERRAKRRKGGTKLEAFRSLLRDEGRVVEDIEETQGRQVSDVLDALRRDVGPE